MPVVPFSAPSAAGGPTGQPKPIELPSDAEPWVLMAAAQMDAEGRLVESKDTTDE